MHDFTLYVLQNEITQAVAYGDRALRFESYEEVYDVNLRQINNKRNEDLSTSQMISKNGLYTFPQGVNYARPSDKMEFWSKWGSYDYNKRIFQGRGDFTLTQNATQAKGQDIYYNALKDELKAQSINALMPMEAKNAK